MVVYRFSDASLIREAAVHYNHDRPPVAFLTARPSAPADKIAEIRKAIEEYGWQCVPANVDGRDVLQVSGFNTREECTTFLAERGFISGTPDITGETDEKQERTLRERARDFFGHYSLPLAGVLNLIGDAGFLGSGIRTKDPYKIAGGTLYTSGGLNLTLFGRHEKSEQRLQKVSQRTADFIQNITMGKSGDAGADTNNTHTAGNLLKYHAAQNTLAAYTAGAGAMLASGIRKYNAGGGAAGLFYGLSSVITKLASFLIPEKAREPGDENGENKDSGKKTGIIGSAVNWVREKPLRIFGYGSMVTDSLLAWDTYQTYKRDPKTKNYLWNAVTAVTYLMADVMAAISSKDSSSVNGKFNDDEQRRVEAIAAETIARQPVEQQGKLADKVSEFLGAQPEMRGKPSDISASIQSQAKHMKDNAWAARVAEEATLQPAR